VNPDYATCRNPFIDTQSCSSPPRSSIHKRNGLSRNCWLPPSSATGRVELNLDAEKGAQDYPQVNTILGGHVWIPEKNTPINQKFNIGKLPLQMNHELHAYLVELSLYFTNRLPAPEQL
jgi:hypothetical protein